MGETGANAVVQTVSNLSALSIFIIHHFSGMGAWAVCGLQSLLRLALSSGTYVNLSGDLWCWLTELVSPNSFSGRLYGILGGHPLCNGKSSRQAKPSWGNQERWENKWVKHQAQGQRRRVEDLGNQCSFLQGGCFLWDIEHHKTCCKVVYDRTEGDIFLSSPLIIPYFLRHSHLNT